MLTGQSGMPIWPAKQYIYNIYIYTCIYCVEGSPRIKHSQQATFWAKLGNWTLLWHWLCFVGYAVRLCWNKRASNAVPKMGAWCWSTVRSDPDGGRVSPIPKHRKLAMALSLSPSFFPLRENSLILVGSVAIVGIRAPYVRAIIVSWMHPWSNKMCAALKISTGTETARQQQPIVG